MVALASLLSALSLTALTTASKFAAVGIAVSDLAKSQVFYETALGLKPTGMKFSTPTFDEVVMQIPGTGTGSAIVLMKYKTPKNTKDLPVKLVFYVEEMSAAMAGLRSAGAKIVNEPGSLTLGNRTIPTAFAKDLDGYLIEVNPLSIMGKGA